MSMTKTDAIQLFGSQTALARALGLTDSAVSQWPEELTQERIDRVTGAAIRLSGLYELTDAELQTLLGRLKPD